MRSALDYVQGRRHRASPHGASDFGAIAQLGERLHGMQEVGGSIPPGSTSLRRLRLLRLGKPYRGEGCHVVARRAKTGLGSARPPVTKAATSLARRAETGLGEPHRSERGRP